MSFLDKIKSFIAALDGTSATQAQDVTPEVKSQPVVEKKVEVAPEPEVISTPQVKATVKNVATTSVTSLQIPEDSALRRHFLSTLKANVIDSMPPRPTDSSLKRHYDAMVEAAVNELLA